ncbi:MAG: antitoxin [Opitutales bacterium]|nr:antitoxin [Opitutales bacterium]
MRTTIDLDPQLMRAVKIKAATEDRTLKDLLAELITIGLGSQSLGAQAVKPSAKDLPSISCKGPPVSNERALALFADADHAESLSHG